jgi:hypothetical protein
MRGKHALQNSHICDKFEAQIRTRTKPFFDVWPNHVFPYVVDHVYYNNYMCTSGQLPTDAERCLVLPNGAQVASAPGAPDGSGHAEQDTDTASDNSDVGDNAGQNMDTDDEDDYPLVRLNPANKADIYVSFPIETTSIAEANANENLSLLVKRSRQGYLSMDTEMRGIVLQTDGTHSHILWSSNPPLYLRHPCSHLLVAEGRARRPAALPTLVNYQGRSRRSQLSSQSHSQSHSQSQPSQSRSRQSSQSHSHSRSSQSQNDHSEHSLSHSLSQQSQSQNDHSETAGIELRCSTSLVSLVKSFAG